MIDGLLKKQTALSKFWMAVFHWTLSNDRSILDLSGVIGRVRIINVFIDFVNYYW